jgi:hypothetical protein
MVCVASLYIWLRRCLYTHEAAWEGVLTCRTSVRLLVALPS